MIMAALAHGQWGSAILEPVSTGPDNDALSRSALALDDFGDLHLLFQRVVGGSDRSFHYTKKPNGGVWSESVGVGDQNKDLRYPYLAVHAPSGNPNLVYLEDGFLKLAVADHFAWSYHDLQTPYLNQLFDPALAVDHEGRAHVALIEETGGIYKMCYGYWDGCQFHFQILQNSQLGDFGSGAYPALCVRSDGSVAISYRGRTTPRYQIDVAENDALGGTTWSYETILAPGYDCYSSSIKATPDDDLHLALHGNLGFGMPNYVFFTTKPAGAPSWDSVVEAQGSLRGGDVKLVVEDSGAAHIIFQEISGNFYTGNICYTTNQSGTWIAELLLKTDKSNPSFVMDEAGNGSLAFEEYIAYGNLDIYYFGYVTSMGLACDTTTIPESTGGVANFTLEAGAANAHRNYLLLGSITGAYPGTVLPGGITLPLNWDLFTNTVAALLNSPVFSNFLGTLDGTGGASAQLSLGPLPLGFTGTVMRFAYLLNAPFDFVSNPAAIEIVP
jgi:hypothetical protein